MNASRAFFAGTVGAIVMSAIMWMARNLMGMEVHLERTLGTMFGGPPTTMTTVMGLVMHLVISGMIALIYAWGFENVSHRAGAGVGAGFGLVHAIPAGLFMGYVLPMMHPMVPESMPGPGPFMANLGMMGIVAFFMLHIIFGAVVGALYTPRPRI